MQKLDYELEVPFVANTGRRCVPACAAMILNTILPERSYSQQQVESMCGFVPDKSTWAAQHLLSFNTLGIKVGWIQDENLAAFADSPEPYMRRQIADALLYEKFMATNDVHLEAKRIKQYMDSGLPFENRPATQEDITNRLLNGWMVRLEVNGKILAGQDGYASHAVVVSGFSDTVIRLENPDGLYGSKPKQTMPWEVLHQAWEEPIMQYYSAGSGR